MKELKFSRMMLLLLDIAPSMLMAQITDELIAPKVETGTTEQEPDAVLTLVEEMPEFPGGSQALFAYMGKQTRYPEDAEEAGVQGKVFLSFVVEMNGSISNVQVLRGAYPSLDQEAIRVVKAMPKWNPGRQNGKPCRTKYNLPFAFVLAK